MTTITAKTMDSIPALDAAPAGAAIIDCIPAAERRSQGIRWLLTLPGGERIQSQYRNDLEGFTPSRGWSDVMLTRRAAAAWGLLDHHSKQIGGIIEDPTEPFVYDMDTCSTVG